MTMIKQILEKVHSRIGDLWWYSAMLFIACRSGDAIQAFIGLWLVPKYVGPQELGAVLPLQQLSSFFTVPLAIVAVVFSKYVNTYATRGERGKVKSFIHDVILVSAALFLVCIAAAYLIIPHFYSRLNIAAGSLTILVLASGFVCNLSNLFGSALQGLKKFNTMTVTSLVSAPIRLVTLLIAMPFRPLSGYLLGQTSPSVICGMLAATSIRNDLKGIIYDTHWRKDIPEILRYIWPVALSTAFGTLFGTILLTVYKQRMSALDSASYYLFSRFADISGYIGLTMMSVMFPIAAESHESGREDPHVLHYTLLSTLGAGIILAVIFAGTGDKILSMNSTWSDYRPNVGILPLMTINTALSAMLGCVTNYEMACRRFTAAFATIALQGVFTVFVVSFTGYDFFRGILSDSVVEGMKSLGLNHLSTMIKFGCASALLQLMVLFALCKSMRPHRLL